MSSDIEKALASPPPGVDIIYAPQAPPFSAELTAQLTHAHTAQNGLINFLDACALYISKYSVKEPEIILKYWNIYLDIFIDQMLELFPALFNALIMDRVAHGLNVHQANGKLVKRFDIFTQPIDVWNLITAWFPESIKRVAETSNLPPDVEIIMLAGHQGSGKDSLAQILIQKGFTILTMSSLISEVAAAWGLDPNQTEDKIITGKVFKEYFGQDILVRLGLTILMEQGIKKIVIVGPRVIEEAKAILDLGGKLIGIRTDSDPQRDQIIRFDRIKTRISQNPDRASDVAKFQNREKTEHDAIESILNLVPKDSVFINNESEKTAHQKFLNWLATNQ